MHQKKQRILLVCLGNICRSPLAEVVMRHQAEIMGLHQQFEFSSAGTGDWHIGGGADLRSAATALQHGLSLEKHKAQQICKKNIDAWDYFIAMDGNNKHDLLRLGVPSSKLFMMREYEGEHDLDVPDPYYGGSDGFDLVYELLRNNATCLLQNLCKQV